MYWTSGRILSARPALKAFSDGMAQNCALICEQSCVPPPCARRRKQVVHASLGKQQFVPSLSLISFDWVSQIRVDLFQPTPHSPPPRRKLLSCSCCQHSELKAADKSVQLTVCLFSCSGRSDSRCSKRSGFHTDNEDNDPSISIEWDRCKGEAAARIKTRKAAATGSKDEDRLIASTVTGIDKVKRIECIEVMGLTGLVQLENAWGGIGSGENNESGEMQDYIVIFGW